jgi:ATP-dependent exoDNAse (exonuclease V) alpha subunit
MQIENDYDKEVYNGDIGTIDDAGSAQTAETLTSRRSSGSMRADSAVEPTNQRSDRSSEAFDDAR